MKAVRLATLAVVLLVAAKAWAVALPAIAVVDAGGMTCPTAGAVTAALSRFGRQRGGGEPFRLLIERSAGQVQVELIDATGRTVLARQIPLTATDCQHAAEAIALIVERHFRTIEWSPAAGPPVAPALAPSSRAPLIQSTSPPPPAPARPDKANPATTPPAVPATAAPVPMAPARTAPAPAASRPAADPPPTAPATAPPLEPAPATPDAKASPAPAVAATATASGPAGPSSPRFERGALPRLAFGAGPAFWSRGSTFAVALDGRWRILAGGPLEVGARVLLPPGHTSTAVGSGGSVHVAAVPVTACVGMAAALGKLAAGVHAGALWTIERGQSESILAPATAWRTVLGAGLGISAAWPLGGRLRLTGALDGYRTVLGRSYAIAGVPGTVLDPSPWQALVVLGAEWVVSP